MSDPVVVPTCYRHADRETYISCQRCGRPICPDCMRDAAVGFQCPECVAEGAKQTRQGRTAYGGRPSLNPGLTSIALIGINAAVWIAIMVTGGAASRLVQWLALSPVGWCASEGTPGAFYPGALTQQGCELRTADGLWVSGVADGAWWQLMTSAFTHVEIWHIGFNMLALWALGPQLEMVLGRVRYLVVYLGSALAGSVMVYWFAATNSYTVGASGAIFGLMGALLVVVLKVRANPQSLLMWIGINFLITVVGRGFISWQGHLGGFLGGLALAAILVYAPRDRRLAVQIGGVSAMVVALVFAIALRTFALT